MPRSRAAMFGGQRGTGVGSNGHPASAIQAMGALGTRNEQARDSRAVSQPPFAGSKTGAHTTTGSGAGLDCSPASGVSTVLRLSAGA
jgi:hypothetical protein